MFLVKTYLVTIAFIVAGSVGQAQAETKSVVDIGFGVGFNYGMLGTKTVIGKNGSGLLIGLGYPGAPAFEIGAQLSFSSNMYINVGYGSYAVVFSSSGGFGSYNGFGGVVGYKLGLGEAKKLYLDAGLGVLIAVGKGFSGTNGGITGGLGVMYSISPLGGLSKSADDGYYYD